ncbi:hypothetical protein NS14008_26365 [Nocardia seriolae]|nr:hypothetical protein NS14008_26365 [Nocardia seriolae]PSK26806.1 hypothetical protein C6575_35260 [Nocardia seriolae]BEK97811.1 hypothetical protein NSER024013_57170 [Nocardia seriolae]
MLDAVPVPMQRFLLEVHSGFTADGGNAAIPKPTYRISDMKVRGDVASARLEFEPDGSQQMYFRRESGRWRVCAPAESQLTN